MDKLEKLNSRLRAARLGVTVRVRGNRLSLRATLPPKQGSNQDKPYQQEISLGIYAGPAGLKRAEAEAKLLGASIASGIFSWDKYIDPGSSPITIGQWVKKFEEYYWQTHQKTKTSETTWLTEYNRFFKLLPDNESLNKKRLLEAVLRSAPNTRSRKRYCIAAGALARFAELDCDFSEFAGSYSTRKTEPRDIPTDAAIACFYQSLKDKPTWQYAYGLMACYGLRNHEVFLLDFESIKKPPGILTVTAGKTGARRVYPIYPE